MEEVVQALKVEEGRRSETMLAPQEVQKMLALQALGWGSKRISRELGCSRNTVRAYLREGGWKPMDTSRRTKALNEHQEWLAERLKQHRGNADVVRQDLARELGVEVSLRTVQRAVEPLRRELRAEAVATVRFETPPGQQMQIDFGSTSVEIALHDQLAQAGVLLLKILEPLDIAAGHLSKAPSPDIDRLLADGMALGHISHRILVGFAEDLDDLLVGESALLHRFLAPAWKPSSHDSIGLKNPGQVR